MGKTCSLSKLSVLILTQDCLHLFSGQGRFGLTPLIVHHTRDWVRSQTVSLIQSTQQIIGQLLSSGASVTPLQKLRCDKLKQSQNSFKAKYATTMYSQKYSQLEKHALHMALALKDHFNMILNWVKDWYLCEEAIPVRGLIRFLGESILLDPLPIHSSWGIRHSWH